MAVGAQEDTAKSVPAGFVISNAGSVALARSPVHTQAHRQLHGIAMTQKICSKCLKAHSGHPCLGKSNLEV